MNYKIFWKHKLKTLYFQLQKKIFKPNILSLNVLFQLTSKQSHKGKWWKLYDQNSWGIPLWMGTTINKLYQTIASQSEETWLWYARDNWPIKAKLICILLKSIGYKSLSITLQQSSISNRYIILLLIQHWVLWPVFLSL